MAYQAIFQRYEMKYMLTRAQKAALLQVMAPYMALDRFGRTTICNLYYDTDSYRLIRRSLEKPAYKEKLRVRSYGTATETGPVFVELKKKYQDVVYKRRVSLPQDEAEAWMRGGEVKQPNQITAEIDYVRGYYEDLIQAKRYFIEKAFEHGAVVFDFQPAELTGDLNNYKDTTHYTPEINDWMVKCFASGEHLVTSENLEAGLEQLKENTDRFREAHIDLLMESRMTEEE